MNSTTEILSPKELLKEFDVERVRGDFPILQQRIKGMPLVYLDNAATSQKPQSVLDALTRYYNTINSNVHRGVHTLSQHATEAYETARVTIQRFLHAPSLEEIVFVRGATEGINLVAQTYGRMNVQRGDEVLISAMEHHSNIVPWQMLCNERGATLRVISINDDGEIDLEDYERLLTKQTKFVSLVHASNALGTVNPIKQMIAVAHRWGVPVLIDGAQAAPHISIDVRDLDCDFYVFSSHKLFGPTGVGVLYGKVQHFNSMPPYQGGGDMIKSVTFEKTIYNDPPYKFEAGTPNIAGAIGLGAAIGYLNSLDADVLAAHEAKLLQYATEALSSIDGLRLIGTAREKVSVVSFVLDNIHPHDVGTVLDEEGIAVRTGHHCAQPVMDRFNVPATIRASFAFYNTKEEIDALVNGLLKAKKVFA